MKTIHTKTKIGIFRFIAILLAGIAFYLLLGNPAIWYKNQKLKQSLTALEDHTTVSLNAVVPFSWDTLYAFGPYQSREEIEEIIGFHSSAIKENMINEGMVHLLFVKDKHVAASILGYADSLGYQIDFTKKSSPTITWGEDARFSVSKAEGITSLIWLDPDPSRTEAVQSNSEGCYPPSVMIGGTLYQDTGYCDSMSTCGTMDGTITSHTSPSSLPQEHEQSNFGDGYSYQKSSPGQIIVVIEGRKQIFRAVDSNGTSMNRSIPAEVKNFLGNVQEIHDDGSLTVSHISTADGFLPMSDGLYLIPGDNLVDEITIGDTVTVWFDGSIEETEPARLGAVYRIEKREAEQPCG